MRAIPLIAALAAVAFLFGCAGLPRAHSNYAVVHALSVQKGDTGLYYSVDDMDYMTRRGVPAAFFVSTARGYYLSRVKAIEAANIIDAYENPITWKSVP